MFKFLIKDNSQLCVNHWKVKSDPALDTVGERTTVIGNDFLRPAENLSESGFCDLFVKELNKLIVVLVDGSHAHNSNQVVFGVAEKSVFVTGVRSNVVCFDIKVGDFIFTLPKVGDPWHVRRTSYIYLPYHHGNVRIAVPPPQWVGMEKTRN